MSIIYVYIQILFNTNNTTYNTRLKRSVCRFYSTSVVCVINGQYRLCSTITKSTNLTYNTTYEAAAIYCASISSILNSSVKGSCNTTYNTFLVAISIVFSSIGCSYITCIRHIIEICPCCTSHFATSNNTTNIHLTYYRSCVTRIIYGAANSPI